MRSAFQSLPLLAMRLLLNFPAFLHRHCLQYVITLRNHLPRAHFQKDPWGQLASLPLQSGATFSSFSLSSLQGSQRMIPLFSLICTRRQLDAIPLHLYKSKRKNTPHPHQLPSIQCVSRSKELYHPSPTPDEWH